MKRTVLLAASAALCLVLASDSCWAVDVSLDVNNGDFNTGSSWADDNVPTDDGDFHFIQDNLTATYSSGVASVTRLIVSDSSPGTLTMTGGDLTIAGGGESFVIGRSLNGNGIVDVGGTATLRTAPGDSGFIGQRDAGALHVGPNGQVISNTVWRIGQFGAVIDAGLEGNGLLDVEGDFSARIIFLGVDDGKGTLRVRGNGSVVISENLQPNVNTFYPTRSASVEMLGSSASLVMNGLESANGAGEVHNQYLFVADAGGVSPVRANNAINITNNDVTVDLTAYTLLPGNSLTLFDAATVVSPFGSIFGTIANLTIIGADSGNYALVYENALGQSGDILLVNVVPEPATMLLLGIGIVAATAVRRRSA